MEPLAILQSDPLDLLFENRNKSYGAYPLRKYYPQRLIISMGIMISLVVLIAFMYLYPESSSSGIPKQVSVPDVMIEEIIFKQELKPPLPPATVSVSKLSATLQYKDLL